MAWSRRVRELATWAAETLPLADAAPYVTAIAYDREPRLADANMERAWRWWLVRSGSEAELAGALGSILDIPDLELRYWRHRRSAPPNRAVVRRTVSPEVR